MVFEQGNDDYWMEPIYYYLYNYENCPRLKTKGWWLRNWGVEIGLRWWLSNSEDGGGQWDGNGEVSKWHQDGEMRLWKSRAMKLARWSESSKAANAGVGMTNGDRLRTVKWGRSRKRMTWRKTSNASPTRWLTTYSARSLAVFTVLFIASSSGHSAFISGVFWVFWPGCNSAVYCWMVQSAVSKPQHFTPHLTTQLVHATEIFLFLKKKKKKWLNVIECKMWKTMV